MVASATNALIKNDQRYKLAKLQLLVVDGDFRAAQMLKTILFSFGIRKIDIVYTAEEALHALRTRRVDLLITERVLEPMSGLELVKSIRAAKHDKLLRFDMPIIMLTAHSAVQDVKSARDIGITEFIAKPFSARTISARLVEIIDNPRVFVQAPGYVGPSRRRRANPPPGVEDRRTTTDKKLRPDGGPKVTITRPDHSLLEAINSTRAADILTDAVVAEAQAELMKSEGEFVTWVKDDIAKLEGAYAALETNIDDLAASAALLRAAYTIKSQAGIFGYELGTTVADTLITYLAKHPANDRKHLVVIRKHIDTIAAIFSQKVKDASSTVGLALIDSLNKLVAKFN